MNIKKIQSKIDSTNYWDERVVSISCDYFADEVTISFGEEKKTTYTFKACYKVEFEHVMTYDKGMPVKNMSKEQIPYFLQDITVNEIICENKPFINCKIDMFPLSVTICCEEISVIQG